MKRNVRTVITAVIIICALLVYPTVIFAESGTSQSDVITFFEYEFENETRGSGAGKITLSAARSDRYYLFWGNGEGDILSADFNGNEVVMQRLAYIYAKKANEKYVCEFNPYMAIPDGAKEVLVITSSKQTVYTYKLPTEKYFDNGEPLYTYGCLSDVHYNRYFNSGKTVDYASFAFKNALDFMDACGADLVGMSGDLTKDGETDSLIKFSAEVSAHKALVLTTSGNHDSSLMATKALGIWRKYVNVDAYSGNLEGVCNMADNKLDFVYRPGEVGDGVFLFLSQRYWDYNNSDSKLLDPEQLRWLENVLEEYKNEPVHMFFHSFLTSENGDKSNTVGNVINDGGCTYDIPYTYNTTDEKKFRSILKKYDNVIMYNGHSHWEFEMEKYNERANIGTMSYDFPTLVHIPSVSSPRTITSDSATSKTELYNKASEGYIAKAYDDCVVLYGVDLWRKEIISTTTYMIITDENGYNSFNSVYTKDYEKDDGKIKYIGVQTGYNSLRLVGTVDSSEYKNVGFDITKKAGDESETLTFETDTVYTEVYSAGKSYTANSLGGEYVFTQTLEKEKTGTVIYIITPFALKDGEKVSGESYKITFRNGKYRSCELPDE